MEGNDTLNLELCSPSKFLECRIAVYLWTVLTPLLQVIGVSGNILSFAVWSRTRMCVSSTSVYLRFLAVIDTSVLFIEPLREFLFHTTKEDIKLVNNVSCRLHNWLSYTATSLSAWMLSALSIDRLVAIKCPLWTKAHCSKKMAFATGMSLTVGVSVFNSHMLFYLNRTEIYGTRGHTNKSDFLDIVCYPDSVEMIIFWNHVWPVVFMVLSSIAPIVCLIICSILLVRELSTMKNNIGSMKNRHNLKPLTKILVVLCLFFIITSMPACTFLIVYPYIFIGGSPKDVALIWMTWAILGFFLYCNNTFNFAIYCLSSTAFRQELRLMHARLKTSVLRRINRKTAPETSQMGPSNRTAKTGKGENFLY